MDVYLPVLPFINIGGLSRFQGKPRDLNYFYFFQSSYTNPADHADLKKNELHVFTWNLITTGIQQKLDLHLHVTFYRNVAGHITLVSTTRLPALGSSSVMERHTAVNFFFPCK